MEIKIEQSISIDKDCKIVKEIFTWSPQISLLNDDSREIKALIFKKIAQSLAFKELQLDRTEENESFIKIYYWNYSDSENPPRHPGFNKRIFYIHWLPCMGQRSCKKCLNYVILSDKSIKRYFCKPRGKELKQNEYWYKCQHYVERARIKEISND